MNSHAVSNFVELAHGYCAWCESAEFGEKPFESAAFWLARLYAAALALPDQPFNDHQPFNDVDVSVSPDIRRKVSSNLSPFWKRSYRLLFDPRTSSDEPPIEGNLGDDLSGVYDDLKYGLIFFELDQTKNAIWEWRFSYQVHWGQHATSALVAIHWLIIGGLE